MGAFGVPVTDLPTYNVQKEFQGGFTKTRLSTRYLVVHHAAAFYPSYDGLADVRSVAAYHKSKGWSGIGYHICLAEQTQGGPIARYDLSDLDTIRAGVAHRNHETLHVSCLTNFGSVRPAQKWIDALVTTLIDLRQTYPNAEIVGHREIALSAAQSPDGQNWSTACPGAAWFDWKPDLLHAVDGARTPILGPARGTPAQMIAWLSPRAHPVYTDTDIAAIVQSYQAHGERTGVDWFTSLAQLAHETGNLTSFWSIPPQRNPAGIGVTGQHQLAQPRPADGWAFNTQRSRWEVGLSFADWDSQSVPAHLGRLLAYTLTNAQASEAQRTLIDYALAQRALPARLRGSATTWPDLDGNWATGSGYGQRVVRLAQRIRQSIGGL